MNVLQAQHQGYAPVMQQPDMNSSSSSRAKRFEKKVYGVGLGEVVIGSVSGLVALISIVVTTATTYSYSNFAYVGHGIWCNAFLITSGALGLYLKCNPSKCMRNANMAMSIISAVFMGLLLILSSIAAAVDYSGGVLRILNSLFALMSFTGLVLSIVHSAFCCMGMCCMNGYSGAQVIYVPHHQMVPVQLPNGQVVMYPVQSNTSQVGLQGFSVQPITLPQTPAVEAATPLQPPVAQAVTPTAPVVQMEQPVQSMSSDDPPTYSDEMNCQK